MTKQSLGKRTVKAGMWNILSAVSESGIRLASNLITTHFLLPEAFGLMMFATTIIMAFGLMSDIGLNQSIVRESDGDTERFLQVTWSFKVRRGVFIAVGVWLVALAFYLFAEALAPAGTVYADQRLPMVIAIIAFAPLLLSAESTAKVVAMRDLAFARIFWVDLFARLLSVVVIVAFALLSPTVWALLAGTLMANVWMLLASHMFFGNIRMRYVRDEAIEARLWSFGRYILGSSALTFVGNNADRFILASLLSPLIFGLYAIALIWVTAGRTILRKVVNFAGFSAMAEIARTQPEKALKVYARIQTSTDIMAVLATLGCMLVAPALLGWLYPGEFEQVGRYLMFLAPTFLAQRFETIMSFILSTGNSRAQMWASSMRTIFVLVALPSGYWAFGIEGVLIASVLSNMAAAPYAIYLFSKFGTRKAVAAHVIWAAAVLAITGWLAATQSL